MRINTLLVPIAKKGQPSDVGCIKFTIILYVVSDQQISYCGPVKEPRPDTYIIGIAIWVSNAKFPFSVI